MRSAFVLALLEAASFLIVTINLRALAKGRVWLTVSTDALISGIGFFVVKQVAGATTYLEMVGYVIGACSGSAAGMYITRAWQDESMGLRDRDESLAGSPDVKGRAPIRTATSEARFESGATPPSQPNPCRVPPPGWYCTRWAGHDGPCAAYLIVNVVNDRTYGDGLPWGYP